MTILIWLVFGFIAGLVAKFLMPGKRKPAGFVATILLGILGAGVGGFIGTELGWGKVNEFDFRSFALAVLGSILLLILYRAFTQND